MNRRTRNHYRGCLLGGAIGDALGAAVEFDSLSTIRRRFGPVGIVDYAPAYGRLGAITDDTQMALFTAEGLLLAHDAWKTDPSVDVAPFVHRAYRRWACTQGEPWPDDLTERGCLVDFDGLFSRRAPGGTCLPAAASGRMGTMEKPLNNSKGCGGIMRVAPVGLTSVSDPFLVGAQTAAITHGHPSAWLPAGFMAQLVADLAAGVELLEAVDRAKAVLKRHRGHRETLAAIDVALTLTKTWDGCAEQIDRLGGGWVGHEALSIALFSTLTADTFEEGVLRAVNISGDSDSTGCIAGALLGLIHGERAIPDRWLKDLELRDLITATAELMAARFIEPDATPLGTLDHALHLLANLDRQDPRSPSQADDIYAAHHHLDSDGFLRAAAKSPRRPCSIARAPARTFWSRRKLTSPSYATTQRLTETSLSGLSPTSPVSSTS